MEQREAALGCRQNPADGDFRSAGSSTKSAVSPGALMQSSGSQMNGGRLDQDDEESACCSQDSNSITDSDKSMQGDGLEEHEFSIKEANFTEGSLKLKIQTTKRPKKPPKNLENYICPPEIKITIKQPGEQKSCRPSKSNKMSKEDEKKKKGQARSHKQPEVRFSEIPSRLQHDFIADGVKPKYQERLNQDQLEWSASSGISPTFQSNVTDVDAQREVASIANTSSISDQYCDLSASQLSKRVSGCTWNQFINSNAGLSIINANRLVTPKFPTGHQEPMVTQTKTVDKNKEHCESTEQQRGSGSGKTSKRDTKCSKVQILDNSIEWDKNGQKGAELEFRGTTKGRKDILASHVTNREPPSRASPIRPPALSSQEKDSGSVMIRIPINPQTPMSAGSRMRKGRLSKSILDNRLQPEPLYAESNVKNAASSNVSNDEGVLTSRSQTGSKAIKQQSRSMENELSQINLTAGRACELTDLSNNGSRVRKPTAILASPVFIDPTKSRRGSTEVKHSKHSVKNSTISAKYKTLSLLKENSILQEKTTVMEPPSAYPITPASPLYSNTDSLTVITPVKKKRGRPKKQPLLTVETIHEGTATSPVSPICCESPNGSKKKKKRKNPSKLIPVDSVTLEPNHMPFPKKDGKINVLDKKTIKTINKMKTMKRKNILNQILSYSNNTVLKKKVQSSSTASTISSALETKLGKQINVSKRGTIYIGKKRGRKPKAMGQLQQIGNKGAEKYSKPISAHSESPTVPFGSQLAGAMSPTTAQPSPPQAVGPAGNLSPVSSETNLSESKAMPNLQPISALPTKTPKSLHASTWKLSPPRLLANSPSHLSEAASLKEITLSPISESHSEETIPSDSGIGTDNNSTSDQAEKSMESRRKYSFDFYTLDPSEGATVDPGAKGKHSHRQKHLLVDDYRIHENMKKQKHRRKRKSLQMHSRDDLQFIADLEELTAKFQVFRISHRSYTFYPDNPYPSIFRVNFDHYYPVPYIHYDPLHYLRRTADLKSKKRRGRPPKAQETMTKVPFLQGFGYPLPGGSYYAPYGMPYTSMPIATGMMNLGYYGQYSAPFYLSHALGSSAPFMRPTMPPPQYHTSSHLKMPTTAKHKVKHAVHLQPSLGMDLNTIQPSLTSQRGSGGAGIPSSRVHKRKHKHKHKHRDDRLMGSREDLGEIFGHKSDFAKALVHQKLESCDKDLPLGADKGKHKEKLRQQHVEPMHTGQKVSKNIFDIDTSSKLAFSDLPQWTRTTEKNDSITESIDACVKRYTSTETRMRRDNSMDPFGDLHSTSSMAEKRENESNGNRKRHFEGFGSYREKNGPVLRTNRKDWGQTLYSTPAAPGLINSHSKLDQMMLHKHDRGLSSVTRKKAISTESVTVSAQSSSSSPSPSPSCESVQSPTSSPRRKLKRREIEAIQCEVRKMCNYDKILATKKNLDHVNKILKAKRLQRQSKTGNNIVKKRRGRPRKHPLPLDEDLTDQMPVLEKCVDLPSKRGLRYNLAPEMLAAASQDTIKDTIEAVICMAQQQQPKSDKGTKRKQKEEIGQNVKRHRKSKETEKEAITTSSKRYNSLNISATSYQSTAINH
ncbi:SET-binding protein [Hypanus sabinus]|uniref:SET-binding protein n=1 Tax=Hypanus sabinus TaxID=79690 RepID=UPI0028C3E5E9|nr:SET-binding protein [Hypanus sabinus]XP_059845473.1 SET-binding protein [Hypanus sabinus]XP_059845474.1 SET-binding protein [Hypanus sabinus]